MRVFVLATRVWILCGSMDPAEAMSGSTYVELGTNLAVSLQRGFESKVDEYMKGAGISCAF